MKKLGNKREIQKKNSKIVVVSSSLSVITLNVNGLKYPIKRQNDRIDLTENIIQVYCFYETHFRVKNTNRLKVKE